MNGSNFYFRFRPIGIDFTDEKEIKKYSNVLYSFSELIPQFRKMRFAYETASKERADIHINAFPYFKDLVDISVYHDIKFKLFSKTVKYNRFILFASVYYGDTLVLFEYATENITKAESIFEELLTNGKLPDFSEWRRVTEIR